MWTCKKFHAELNSIWNQMRETFPVISKIKCGFFLNHKYAYWYHLAHRHSPKKRYFMKNERKNTFKITYSFSPINIWHKLNIQLNHGSCMALKTVMQYIKHMQIIWNCHFLMVSPVLNHFRFFCFSCFFYQFFTQYVYHFGNSIKSMLLLIMDTYNCYNSLHLFEKFVFTEFQINFHCCACKCEKNTDEHFDMYDHLTFYISICLLLNFGFCYIDMMMWSER